MDYFSVCFYPMLFTLKINAIEQILVNFVPVFKSSYFPFFSVFHVILNFLYKFK